MCKITEDRVRQAMQRMFMCTPEQLPLLEDIEMLQAFRRAYKVRKLPADFCHHRVDIITLVMNCGYILERNGINANTDA